MKLDPQLKKYLEIGYEFEFAHDLRKCDIKENIESILQIKCKWISRTDRAKSKTSQRKCFTLYHDFTIDVDYGDQNEWELVTPVWDYAEGIEHLIKILAWMEYSGGTTNKSTALHFGLSLKPPYKTQNVDKLQLIKNVDEEKILKKFKRLNNTWCIPHMKYLSKRSEKQNPIIHTEQRDRAISFRRPHYMEFRMIGNKDYHKRWTDIVKTIEHCGKSMLSSYCS